MSLPTIPPICFMCKHLIENDQWTEGNPRCAAFPEGIPDEIWLNGYDHRNPLGDERVTFQLAEGISDEQLEQWNQIALNQVKGEALGALDQFE